MLKIKNASKEHYSTMATEQLDCCPNCGSKQTKVWCSSYDRLHNLSTQVFIYSRCKDCGLLFLSNRPPEQEIYRFYPSDYAPYQSRGEVTSKDAIASLSARHSIASLPQRALNKLVSTLNNRYTVTFPNSLPQELRQFYQPASAGLKLLDFGCGSDRFLNSARQRGWETLGIDFNLGTVEQVQHSGHQAFLVSPDMWAEIEDESIDCVRMSHVLEHLYQPKQVLTDLHRKMKPGARIHISVPNPKSISAALFRSRWFDLDCPRHIMLYSPKVLETILEGTSYSITRILHEPVARNFSRSLAYLLNDLQRDKGLQQSANQQKLEQLFFIPANLSALFEVSDRFHMFAVKK